MVTSHSLILRKVCYTALLLCLFIQSCALLEADKPAEWSGFISEVSPEQQMEGLPWDHSWEVTHDYSRYTFILFKPVRTDYLNLKSKQEFLKTALLSESHYNEAVASLAVYMRESIYKAFDEFDNHRLTIVEEVGENTLVVETALTEVVFHDPSAYITSLAVPLPGSTYALDSMISPSIAFEMRVTDGTSGELLSTLADRSLPVLKPVDLRKFTLTGPLKEIIETWSEELAVSANQVVTEKMEERRRFKLF